MIRATTVIRRDAVPPGPVADRIVLDHADRHRRRVALTAEGGLAFLLDLDRATVLEDGDALRLEDGGLVRVEARPERLLEIRSGTPLGLKRLIWHIGNRHVPAEMAEDAVYIAHDHVLAEMVRGLGGTATPLERPFRPEGGAYEGGGGSAHAEAGHAHAHSHARADAHGHAHAHVTVRSQSHSHVHAGSPRRD